MIPNFVIALSNDADSPNKDVSELLHATTWFADDILQRQKGTVRQAESDAPSSSATHAEKTCTCQGSCDKA